MTGVTRLKVNREGWFFCLANYLGFNIWVGPYPTSREALRAAPKERSL